MCLMGWQGAGGEAVLSVFNGVAGCGWRGGVECGGITVAVRPAEIPQTAVLSVFNGVAGCGWRGGVQCGGVTVAVRPAEIPQTAVSAASA